MRRVIVVVVVLLTLLPQVSSGIALLAGIVLALTIGNPAPQLTRPLAQRTLTWSVVALGAEMNLGVVARVGLHGVGYTALGVGIALAFGTWLGKRLGVGRDLALLLSVGTAICGGSAIAAAAPAIHAKEEDVSIALVTVFVLNAVALFLFPAVGHALHMSEDSFGLWAALAIHDTSSVVGAASQYGTHALEVATAAKLARALWIIPVTVAIALQRRRSRENGPSTGAKPKRPWFIAGFLLVAALVTYIPALRPVGHIVGVGAHRLLAMTLCLIGLGLTRPALRALGIRPMLTGIGLWTLLGTGTLGAILLGWIR